MKKERKSDLTCVYERERERGQPKPTLLGYRFEQSKTIKIMFSGCFIENHGQIEIASSIVNMEHHVFHFLSVIVKGIHQDRNGNFTNDPKRIM